MFDRSRIARFAPLALVSLLHVGVIVSAGLPPQWAPTYGDGLLWLLEFPIQLTMIAVWLALSEKFWERLPWALILGIAATWWYTSGPAFFGYLASMLLTCLYVVAALAILFITRRCFGPKRPLGPIQFSLRHILIWMLAAALMLSLAQKVAPVSLGNRIWESTRFDHSTFYMTMLAVEYFLMAQSLIAMIVARRFFRWVLPWALVLFPTIMLIETALVAWLVGAPWFFDPEAWIDVSLQMSILAATLLAWRHSGLMPEARPTLEA